MVDTFWYSILYISQSVQLLTHVQLFATPWTATRQASLSITNSRSLLKLMSSESVKQSNYLILCRPLLLLPSISPSIRIFSFFLFFPISGSFQMSQFFTSGGQSTGVSASESVLPMISFRMDWLDLLWFQGTLKSLLQQLVQEHKIFVFLYSSAFCIVQLSHTYMLLEKP